MREENRSRLGSIIIVVLAIVLAAFMIYAKLDEREQVKQAMKEAEEYEASEDKNKGNAAAILDDLEAKIEIPEFVMWGDKGAAGSSGNLAAEFNKAADTALFNDLYEEYRSHSSTVVENFLNINMDNAGVVNEGMAEILARAGAEDIVTRDNITIPASEDSHVLVEFADSAGNDLMFASQENIKFDETTINGVKGYLYDSDTAYDDNHMKMEFKRSNGGSSVEVSAGTPVIAEFTGKYSECIPVLFFDSISPGKEDDSDSADINSFVNDLNKLISAHSDAAEEKKYIVILTTEEGSEEDAALSAAFGEHYIRNGKKASDMTEDDYKALADKVFSLFEEQGCFDDVNDEINTAIDKFKKLSD